MLSTSPFSIMKVFLILLLLLTGGCASDRPPSGGPTDTTPLQVIVSNPAQSAVNVSTNRIQLTFNQNITARQLLNALFISPSIGACDISVDGKVANITGFKPLEKNRSYLLTIDKNLRDIRGRTFPAPYTLAFSTGAAINNGSIGGKVIHADFSPAANALLLAFAKRPADAGAENLLQGEPDYLVQTDASGTFSFKYIAAGSYRIVAIHDQNNDLRFNPATEEFGLCSTAIIPVGSTDLLFRLPGMQKKSGITLSAPPLSDKAYDETGIISGTCFASGPSVIVNASGLTTSYSTTASRERNGTWRYSFKKLPAGSYTISAFVPSATRTPDPERHWNPGSLEPFQPCEPFGFYPEKVTVRPRWTTEHIDIRIITSKEQQ